jgi:hypothetical protein
MTRPTFMRNTEHEITMEIDSGVVEGKFPRRALSAVLDWHDLRQEELANNWMRARQELPLEPIPPLE